MELLPLIIKFFNSRYYYNVLENYEALSKECGEALDKYIKEKNFKRTVIKFSQKEIIYNDRKRIKDYDILIRKEKQYDYIRVHYRKGFAEFFKENINYTLADVLRNEDKIIAYDKALKEYDVVAKQYKNAIESYMDKEYDKLNYIEVNEVISNIEIIKKIEKIFDNYKFEIDFPLTASAILSKKEALSKNQYWNFVIDNGYDIPINEEYIKLRNIYSDNAIKTILNSKLVPKNDSFTSSSISLKRRLIVYNNLSKEEEPQAIISKNIRDSKIFGRIVRCSKIEYVYINDQIKRLRALYGELSIKELLTIIKCLEVKIPYINDFFRFVSINANKIMDFYKISHITVNTYVDICKDIDKIIDFIDNKNNIIDIEKILTRYALGYNILVKENKLEAFNDSKKYIYYIKSNEEKIIKADDTIKHALDLKQKYPLAFKFFVNKNLITDNQELLYDYEQIIKYEDELINLNKKLEYEEKLLVEKTLKEREIRNLKQCVSDWYDHTYNGSVKHKWFYDYYSYQEHKNCASSEMWSTWKLIWNFKNNPDKDINAVEHNEALNSAVISVEKLLAETFNKDTNKLTLVCLTASSKEKNERRFKVFSEKVCGDLGMHNAFDHINIITDGEAKHEGGTVNACKSYDKAWFKDKYIVLFDDVRTTGSGIEKEKQMLESFGATVICAITLGQTRHL